MASWVCSASLCHGTPPYDGSCKECEYTHLLLVGKRMWIPYRSTGLSWYRMGCNEIVRICRLMCLKRKNIPAVLLISEVGMDSINCQVGCSTPEWDEPLG